MTPLVNMPLDPWANFYVVVGSSAGALTGLQFVVMALVAEARPDTSGNEIGAFGTPTIVHFCAVLLVSAILSAPWPSLASAGVAVFFAGSWGVAYGIIVLRRALGPINYQPGFEDWIWFSALPLVANAAIVAGAAFLPTRPTGGLFTIAAASLLLLFVGIHNAWDSVTYIVTTKLGKEPPE